MHRLKYGLPSTHWISPFQHLLSYSPKHLNTCLWGKDFSEFLPAVFGPRTRTQRESVRTSLSGPRRKKRQPINGWNLKDKTDKKFPESLLRILLLHDWSRVFFLWTIAQLFGCRWVGELGATSIWHRFSLTEHCQLYCSWTYLYTNCSFFIFAARQIWKLLGTTELFSSASEFVPFFSQNDQVSTKEFQKYDIDPDRSDS